MPSLLVNKTAKRDYHILETIEAGIELLGTEVKSLRAGRGVLTGAHVVIRDGRAYVVGMQIPPWQARNVVSDYDPARTRELLLTKHEIGALSGNKSRAGQTLVPLSVYTKGKKLKMEVGVARGKKAFDKREDIKKREDKRIMRRAHKEASRGL